MPARITLSQVIDNLTDLSKRIDRSEFIYDFLLCFGLPNATIARLKTGNINVSKKPGCILLKGKVFFDGLEEDLLGPRSPLEAIEAAKADRQVRANKPRFLIATDFETFFAWDTKKQELEQFPIAELHKNYEFLLPLAGMEKTIVHEEAEADVKAAEQMAKLYDLIRLDNPTESEEERHALNIFLTRLLFCYFAEDTGIFPENSFASAIQSYTQPDGSDLPEFFQQLFLTLNQDRRKRTNTPEHLQQFDYVNGGLFNDTLSSASHIPSFSARSRQKLIELGSKSWKEINPDIFGSMFQGVVDDGKRAELGMHYTSVPNIMKVIKPLFLDDLEEDFEASKDSEAKLNKLLNRIYHLRLFDPACGSGNFLIISYKELRRLEMRIYKRLREITGQLPLSFSGIQVSQFYGIEIDDFACEVAILALWLAEHQMNIEFRNEFETTPPSLPLKDGAQIVCQNSTRIDWNSVCPKEAGFEILILGNPPYQGARRQSDSQKEDMIHAAGELKGHRNLDYIACFFLIAAKYIKGTRGRIAFVATNSISQGEQVSILWPEVLRDLEICFAHQPFKWTNSAKSNAGVTCVIIGLEDRSAKIKIIYSTNIARSVKAISPYIVPGKCKFITKRSKPISDLSACNFGSMPNDGGHLLLSREERTNLLNQHPESNIFIRELLGTEEFIDGKKRFCLWVDDCDLEKAESIPPIRERISLTREHRLASSREATKRLALSPHRFGENRHKQGASILIPCHTSELREYIPSSFNSNGEIIHNSAIAVYDAELWVFAVISSKIHLAWVRAVAGGLETRIRYSASICYNNFPLPEISISSKTELSSAAEKLLLVRERYLEKNIAWLYSPNSMPEDLLSAHADIDLIVDRVFREKPFLNDEERLEHLFKLYEKMTEHES